MPKRYALILKAGRKPEDCDHPVQVELVNKAVKRYYLDSRKKGVFFGGINPNGRG
jgi:hypothetical protein